MKYRQLADTGVFVSELCLGAMTFGGHGGMWEVIAGLDQPAVDAIVHRSIDAGINFIDTANVYAAGESETMLGKALAGRRHEIVLATKVRGRMGKGANDVGLSRLHITQAADASLKRLGTDYIDLYQVHRFDAHTSLEDTLRALDDLVRAGKVRYIGCSNYAAWQIMKALAISKEQHLERFRCTQSYYSLAGRELEREIVPLIKDQHLGLLVWSPLAGGFLSGKFTRHSGDEAARRASFDFPPVNKERAFDIIDVLLSIAGARRVSAAQVAIAWLLAQPVTTSVIIGARRMSQLDDNLGSVQLTLTAEELGQLDDVSRLTPEYPAWMSAAASDDRLPGQERRFSTSRPAAQGKP
ncbi:MAG TPA: aldo/keto reductase [Vicinamibacterales bacterium]|nr:aldo/keto reductase [Vicinamibacterales bacterium]